MIFLLFKGVKVMFTDNSRVVYKLQINDDGDATFLVVLERCIGDQNLYDEETLVDFFKVIFYSNVFSIVSFLVLF